MNHSITAAFAFPFMLLAAAGLLVGCGGGASSMPSPDSAQVELIRTSLKSTGDGTADPQTGPSNQPAGYATLRGSFRLDGTPPDPTALSITKDKEVCAPGGKTVYDNDMTVDPDTNGIANVLLYVDGIPKSWIHPSAQLGSTDEIVFDQKNCIFLTRVVAMQTSQKLKVLNSDPVGHNLMVASFNQTIPSGGVAYYEPLREQRSPVEMRCSIHPWMKAWFINRDNGYFAVSQSDGSFQLPNLPAGVEVELRVWQERSGPISEATVNGEPVSWSRGKMSLVLEPDSTKDMEVVLDATIFN